jgi:hypothetical protein
MDQNLDFIELIDANGVPKTAGRGCAAAPPQNSRKYLASAQDRLAREKLNV